MASEYLTIRDPGKGEYEEKKSRFLGEAVPVSSEEEAAEYIAGVRKKYYDDTGEDGWIMVCDKLPPAEEDFTEEETIFTE